MTKQITFHKHEVIGAAITEQVMNRFQKNTRFSKSISNLVRLHQVRFYNNTKDSTYKHFLRELLSTSYGSNMLMTFFKLLKSDRAGNSAKNNLPQETFEMKNLYYKLQTLSNNLVLESYLTLQRKDLKLIGYSDDQIEKIVPNLIGIVQGNRLRNDPEYLLTYVTKNYRLNND